MLKYMLNEHKGSVSSLCFTPDGNTLISGGADETIRLWEAASGRCLAAIPLELPYAGMNVLGATGISAAQRAAIRALGAIEGTDLAMKDLL